LDLFGNAKDDVGGRGFARDMRKEGKADASYSRGVQASEFFQRNVLIDTRNARRSAFHVLQSVDHNAVVGAVAGGLDDDESPEPHFVDEDFVLFLPWGSEGFVLGFGGQGESVEGTDDVHMSVDRSVRHSELEGVGMVVLFDIRINNDGVRGHDLYEGDGAAGDGDAVPENQRQDGNDLQLNRVHL